MTYSNILKQLRNEERYQHFLLMCNDGWPPYIGTIEDYRTALYALEDGINDAINTALNV